MRSMWIAIALGCAAAGAAEAQSSIGVTAVVVEPVTVEPLSVEVGLTEAGQLSVREEQGRAQRGTRLLRRTYIRVSGEAADATNPGGAHGVPLRARDQVVVERTGRLVITRVIAANS